MRRSPSKIGQTAVQAAHTARKPLETEPALAPRCLQAKISAQPKALIRRSLTSLDRSKSYFLSSSQCYHLSEEFLFEGDWRFEQVEDHVRCVCAERETEISFVDFKAKLIKREFSELDPNRTAECSFTLAIEDLRNLVHWEQEHSDEGYEHIPFPQTLALAIDGQHNLNLAFPLNPLICRSASKDLKILGQANFEDRFIRWNDILSICELAVDHNQSIKCVVFSTFELCNGIELEVGGAANAKVFLPLAVSVPGDPGQITEKLAL